MVAIRLPALRPENFAGKTRRGCSVRCPRQSKWRKRWQLAASKEREREKPARFPIYCDPLSANFYTFVRPSQCRAKRKYSEKSIPNQGPSFRDSSRIFLIRCCRSRPKACNAVKSSRVASRSGKQTEARDVLHDSVCYCTVLYSTVYSLGPARDTFFFVCQAERYRVLSESISHEMRTNCD